MSENKVVKKIKLVNGGLTKEESQKVFGGRVACNCGLDDEVRVKALKGGPNVPIAGDPTKYDPIEDPFGGD